MTSTMEISRVTSTSRTEARMVVVRSSTTARSMAGGIEACNCGSEREHPVHGVDDVGAGLAEDDDQHGRLAVDQPGVAQVLDRIAHLRDIGQTHRGAVVVGDDQRRIVGRLEQLIGGR